MIATPTTPTPRSTRLLDLTAPVIVRLPWLWLTLGTLLVTGVITALTDGTPTYDPWAWIIWGREIIEGDLVTTTGPSWKPLPMLFTIPFALFGDAAPDLWLWIGRATAVLGLAAVAQLAARLGGRLAGWLSVAALASTPLYYAYGINGSSEGMLVLFCALGATAWLSGKRSHAFWWLVLASLLRPEIWFFVAFLGLERLKDRPQRIWWVSGAGALVIASWLIPEKIGSGAYTRAATRANAPNPDSAAFADSPTLEVLGSMGDLLLWVPAIGLLVTAAIGAWMWRGTRGADGVIGRDALRAAAALTVMALVWVAIVAAMTEGGYAGNPRYLVAPLGIFVAVAAGGIAWTARLLALRGGVRVAELVVFGAIVLLVVAAGSRLPRRAAENTYQSQNRTQLSQLAGKGTAAREQILACRPITTHPLMIPPVAWTLGLHLDELDFHELPDPQGTFIVGRNVEANLARPTRIPAGAKVIARSEQITIHQTC